MRTKHVAAAIIAVAIGAVSYFAGSRHAANESSSTARTVEVRRRSSDEEVRVARAVENAAEAVSSAAERARTIDSSRRDQIGGGGAAPAAAAPIEPSITPSGLPTVFNKKWPDGKFADFTPDELADMASRCELRWQLPATPDDRYLATVRSLYAELTGDPAEAAHARLRTMTDALRVDADDDVNAVHRRLAARRAGDEVTLSGSVYERFLQLQLDESERAHQENLPPGPRFTVSGCDPQTALFRSTR